MIRILAAFILIISSSVIKGNDGYRRNPDIDVLNYSFTVTISDDTDIIFGRTEIMIGFSGNMALMEFDLKNIRSDSKGMVVDSVRFSECEIEWSHSGDRVTIVPDISPKGPGKGVVEILYHGIPADGLVISNNKFGSRTFFSDHWPDRASNYLPCIDHPYDKATLEFTIIAPSHYEVIASGYRTEVTHLQGDMKLNRWRENVPLATKVMAFGAARFDIKLAGILENIPVWTYVFPENREEGFFDYSVAVKPLAFFSELIGPYPFEKLANVQSKTIFGGLENAGCIFYSERSVTGRGRAEGLLAHEIAHQWFGNSVTENDWHHIWLSEGFATYLTSVYMEMTYGKERYDQSMKAAKETVMKHYLKSPGPVIDTTVTDLMKLLNANSYQKGAWVLHMLRRRMGDEIFWKGIRLFYEKYSNGNAGTDDFKEIMEQVGRTDLDTFFTQWLWFPGQPDLKITSRPSRRNGRTDIIIEQKQKELFSFPLELLINSQKGTFREEIGVSQRITKLTFKKGPVGEIIPDPDGSLLFRLME